MTHFFILYWDTGCDIRKENAKISWKLLKKMVSFLQKKGLNIKCSLFEYGNDFYFEDSVKIKINLSYYERSKKINIALNHEINENIDYVGIMDSDLFFTEEQYDEIYEDVKKIETNNIFLTYNALDIEEDQRKQVIIDENINFDKLENIKCDLNWRH
jgi:hypothetical protein